MEDSKGISAKNNLYNVYKHNALKRGLKFDLSKAKFYLLTKSNCFYCGSSPSRVHNHQDNGYVYHYTYNGIDRLDNNIGYSDKNCVSCCFQCNKAKWTLSLEDFCNYINLVYSHMSGYDLSNQYKLIEFVEDSKGDSARGSLMTFYKQNAKKKGLDFFLSKKAFYKLTKQNCFYCGIPPNKVHKMHYYKKQLRYYTYNGVDRINSDKGYYEENRVPCCFQCNKAKWTLSTNEFIKYIYNVYDHMLEFGFFDASKIV